MLENIREIPHPSIFIKEYIEDLEITQDEFAKRLGISGKQISLLLSKKANITQEIALKLSNLLGTSVELWINLQSKYDSYMYLLKSEEEFKEEKNIFKMIDKSFLKKLNMINENEKVDDQIKNLRKQIPVASLSLLKNKDIYSFYRESINKQDEVKNIICKNFWVSIAHNIAVKKETKTFNEDLLKENIIFFRNLTTEKPNVFYNKIVERLADCGIAFVVLPYLKNSNINSAVKWINSEKVMLAMNDRGSYNDKFWFSFFHELKHVLQKQKRKFIISEQNINDNNELEKDADLFAKEILIPSTLLVNLKNFDKQSIINFSKKINIHPGILVGRLQKEEIIKYNFLNDLKEKFYIE